ncbi:MAG: hypothetical protein QOI86_3001, partial [Actinomycetota bacterium]|nr:hypothetical protein [Actinomycetota bacterium]
AAAIEALGTVATGVGTFINEGASAFITSASNLGKIAGLGINIGKIGVEFVGISAAATAAGNAAAGLTTDWAHWSPVPTTAEGWAEFIAMGVILLPIGVVAAKSLEGLIPKAYRPGGVVNDPVVEVNTGITKGIDPAGAGAKSGTGIKVNTDLPPVNGSFSSLNSGGKGKLTDPGEITSAPAFTTASRATGPKVENAARATSPDFRVNSADPVLTRSDSGTSINSSPSTVSSLTDASTRPSSRNSSISDVSSLNESTPPVNSNVRSTGGGDRVADSGPTPKQDPLTTVPNPAGGKATVRDEPATTVTPPPGGRTNLDVAPNNGVKTPLASDAVVKPADPPRSTENPGSNSADSALSHEVTTADPSPLSNAANIGGGWKWPSDMGRSNDHPATGGPEPVVGPKETSGGDPSSAPVETSRGYDFPATIDNTSVVAPPVRPTDNFAGPGQVLGGHGLGAGGRADRLQDSGEANALTNVEEGSPLGGGDAFRETSPSVALKPQGDSGRGYDFPATSGNAGEVVAGGRGDNLAGSGQALGGNAVGAGGRADRLQDSADSNASANVEEGLPPGGGEAFRQSSPSVALRPQGNSGRGYDFPAKADNDGAAVPGRGDSFAQPGQALGGNAVGAGGRADRLQDSGESNALRNVEEGLPPGGGEAFRASSPSVALKPQGSSGRGYDYPATSGNAGEAGAAGRGDSFAEPGHAVGGAEFPGAGGRADKLQGSADDNALANVEEGLPPSGGEAFRQSSPSVASRPQGESGRGYDYPATSGNAGEVVAPGRGADNFGEPGHVLGGDTPSGAAVEGLRADKLQDNADFNALADMEEGHAGEGLAPGPFNSKPSVAIPPTGTGRPTTLADLAEESADGNLGAGSGDHGVVSGSGGQAQRGASTGSSTVTIDPNSGRGKNGDEVAGPGRQIKTSSSTTETETVTPPNVTGAEG